MSAKHELRIALREQLWASEHGLAIVAGLPTDTCGMLAELAGDFAAASSANAME